MNRKIVLVDDGHRGVLPVQSIHPVLYGRDRYVLPSLKLNSLVVFDRAGKISRIVDGPAETPFKMITSLMPADDNTLQVYDTMTRTLSVLDTSFKIIRTSPARYWPNFLLPGNHYIHAQQIATKELVGQPIHLLGPDFKVLKSFGADSTAFRADEPLKYDRVVAPGPGGTVWAAPPGQYVLEQWTPSTGAKARRIEVTSSWFVSSTKFPSPNEKPRPIILSLWITDAIAWVLLRDSDPKWAAPAESTLERALDSAEYERTFDTVLEAVDLTSGRVLASKRFDEAVWGRPPALTLATRRQTSRGGQTQLELWQPTLVNKKE